MGVIAGGTGKVGRLLSSTLTNSKSGHTVTILCRNKFLASAPSRVSSDFGWVGKSFLDKNPNVNLRDWDGGDLLDIVGCDWMGSSREKVKKRMKDFKSTKFAASVHFGPRSKKLAKHLKEAW